MPSEIKALHARVRALQRKLARELAAYRLDLLSRDLSHRWFVAQSDHKPLPDIQPFIRLVIDAGYRLLPWGAANNYLQDCLRKKPPPTPKCCSMSSSPRPGNLPPVGPLADGKTWHNHVGATLVVALCAKERYPINRTTTPVTNISRHRPWQL